MKLVSILWVTLSLMLPFSSVSAVTNPVAAEHIKSQLININKATAAELTQLPGIGESKAKAIVDYRTNKGPFKSFQQLAEVKGIGSKLLEKLDGKVAL
ncbi:ComEA family DNA-binding protein [Pseudoalteromonas mariniglutinosa]|uniref:ComEA family DNA-binding protein n=1 Tax=Pseudoalteromonas mariniglutinosa TaxID=206042 RepID=UPI0038509B23